MSINKNLPYYEKQHNYIIPSHEQFVTITVGQRGQGKSATQERLLEELFKEGWTCFDAWSAGFESMFYCVNLDCKKRREEETNELKEKLELALNEKNDELINLLTDEYNRKKNELGCTCSKQFPITILCSEAIDIDQRSIDIINGKFYTKQEWVKKMRKQGEMLVEYDNLHPPEKSSSERTEWIRVVKLPFPSKTEMTEVNQEIINLFEKALLDARKERRILCYVPSLFPTDYARYRTIAVIVSNLPKITAKHFQALYEGKDINKPKSQWNKHQKNHHRLVMLMRELAEIAPSRMKTNEFANLTKRAILSIIYTSRHSGVSILSDVQKVESVFSEVRAMTNSIIIKRSTPALLGDDLKDIKKRIEILQDKLFEKFGRSDEARQFVYSKYPPLEKLNKNYCYVLYDDDFLEKWHIPSTLHHKKQEDDSFEKLTGFRYEINEESIKSHNSKKDTGKTAQVNADKELFDFIKKSREQNIGWKQIKEKLVEEQAKGKFTKQESFKDKDHNSIGKWFKRNIEKFD